MHLHLNCFLFFLFFQGEHSSTIEKSYFCKRKKKNKVWKEWYERPPLAQEMGGVNSRICPMVHKNFHETVCFVCTTLGCVLLIHSCLYGKHTLVKKTKKETVPLTQLLFYSVTLCHTLLIPVSCSLSNHRLFLKLACSYLLSFLSYSYPFSNCSSYFLLPMVLFCFYFIVFFNCFLVFSSCTRGHFVLDDLCPCEVLVPLFYHWLH